MFLRRDNATRVSGVCGHRRTGRYQYWYVAARRCKIVGRHRGSVRV